MRGLPFTILNVITLATAIPFSSTILPNFTLPDNDQFYAAPPGFEHARLGSILRYRRAPRAITLNNKTPIKPKEAWQIQFRTQNSLGQPEAGIVTVLVPYNAKPHNLFVEGYLADAAYNDCNPSLTLQLGDRSDNTVAHLQTMIVIAALNEGYYVSVADDTGARAAFGSGLHSGYTTLDSIRAVKQSSSFTGIQPEPRITMNGYSGGAFAVAWASELQPSYAPELEIAGAALGGLTPNVTALIANIQQENHRKFAPVLLLGLSHDYQNLSNWLSETLVPSLASEFRMAERQCYMSDDMYTKKDVGRYFKGGLQSLYGKVPMSVVDSTSVMGLRGTPRHPWYLYHSTGDTMSPIELTKKLMDKHCANGADIYFEENEMDVDHAIEALVGFPGAFTWLNARQSGWPVEAGCSTTSFSDASLVGLLDAQLGRGIWDSLMAVLGIPISG